MAKPLCSCGGDVKMVLACAGASNVGQMTNEAAKRLDEAGAARYFCLAGVGGHVSAMVESVKGADKVIVLDGCDVACAKKTMGEAGIEGYEYLVVTDLGIEKVHEFKMPAEQVELVRDKATVLLK